MARVPMGLLPDQRRIAQYVRLDARQAMEALKGPSRILLGASTQCRRAAGYAMVGAAADGVSLADPALQTEVRGLVPTSDCPADIFTTGALPGTSVALDITIASQEVSGLTDIQATPV